MNRATRYLGWLELDVGVSGGRGLAGDQVDGPEFFGKDILEVPEEGVQGPPAADQYDVLLVYAHSERAGNVRTEVLGDQCRRFHRDGLSERQNSVTGAIIDLDGDMLCAEMIEMVPGFHGLLLWLACRAA